MGIARVEPRVLHDDRHVRADHGRIGSVVRHALGIGQLVEPHVLRAARLHPHPIRTCRIPVLEIKRELYRRWYIGSVENAGCFVRHELRLLAEAATGNVAFSNGPNPTPENVRSPQPHQRAATPMVPGTTRFGAATETAADPLPRSRRTGTKAAWPRFLDTEEERTLARCRSDSRIDRLSLSPMSWVRRNPPSRPNRM